MIAGSRCLKIKDLAIAPGNDAREQEKPDKIEIRWPCRSFGCSALRPSTITTEENLAKL